MSGERVLITGANGQDGGYLTQRLLAEGHEVHGMCHSESGRDRYLERFPGASAHICDLGDALGLALLVSDVEPTHIYNLAGNTSVARSWEAPAETADVLGVGPVRLLESAWRISRSAGRDVRFVQASSAEIFGDAPEAPQSELTARRPVTPYGAAKAFAHDMVGVYRQRGMHASTAILYNHESPSRPETFVARKITRTVAAIAAGRADTLTLGNIDVERDWGFAPDYVDAMVRIARADEAGDYIVATGSSHTVRDFVRAAFAAVGIEDWESHVRIDPALYRPADPKRLVGDSRRLRSLGWAPSVTFEELVALMVAADVDLLGAG